MPASLHSRALAALFVLALAPAPACAQTALSLVGQAQLVCSAGIDGGSAATSSQSAIDLGQLREFCNDPNGYDVWIDYPANLAGGSLIVDGAQMPLSAQGSLLVSHVSQAGAATHTLALNAPGAGSQVSLTVRMSPVGAGDFAAP